MGIDTQTLEIAKGLIGQLDKLDDRVNEEGVGRSGDRDPFQRDYTRVMYSSSFRRLQGKMQLLGLHNEKFFRNRLTHSLEVSQIARAIAENFGYEKTYAVETAALAHDIGNPPFGHYGEKVLNDLASDFGGYEGNAQSLRVLTALEKKNPQTRGLNLTVRSLFSITKYFVKPDYVFNETEHRPTKFIYPDDYDLLKGYVDRYDLLPRTLDAQIMDLADEIAYAAHDLEDGLSMRLFTIEDIVYEYQREIKSASDENVREGARIGFDKFMELVERSKEVANRSDTYGSSEEYALLLKKEILGNIVNVLITSIGFQHPSEKKQKKHGICNEVELDFVNVGSMAKNLKDITFKCINRSDMVQLYEKQGETILRSLYEVFIDKKFNKGNILLPPEYRNADSSLDGRSVIDYLSGMMDSYAIASYKKYFGEIALDNVYQGYKEITKNI